MRLRLLMTAIFLCGIFSAQNVVEYWKPGIKKEEFTKKHSKLNGEYTWYYQSGKLKRSSYYENDIRKGREVFYYEDGKICEESFYKNGLLDSSHTQYYPNGTLRALAFYQAGKAVGLWHSYKENGKLESETQNDPEKILSTVNYYDDGKVAGEFYKNRAGNDSVSRFFAANGKVQRVYYFNSKISAVDSTFYFDAEGDGRMISYERVIRKENYLLVDAKSRNKNGKLVYEAFSKVTPDSFLLNITRVYYDNGTPQSYHADSFRISKGKENNANDAKGCQLRFRENGNKSEEMIYSDGRRSFLKRFYYANGDLKNEEYYENNLKTGEWKTFNEAGEQTCVQKFRNDTLLFSEQKRERGGKFVLQGVYDGKIRTRETFSNAAGKKIWEQTTFYGKSNELYEEWNDTTGHLKKHERKGDIKNRLVGQQERSLVCLYFPNGKLQEVEKRKARSLTKKERFKKWVKVKVRKIRYFENGEIATKTFETTKKNKKKRRLGRTRVYFVSYYPNGKIKTKVKAITHETVFWTTEIEKGTRKKYDESGKLISTDDLKNTGAGMCWPEECEWPKPRVKF